MTMFKNGDVMEFWSLKDNYYSPTIKMYLNSNWLVCDGTQGTPDARAKMVDPEVLKAMLVRANELDQEEN